MSCRVGTPKYSEFVSMTFISASEIILKNVKQVELYKFMSPERKKHGIICFIEEKSEGVVFLFFCISTGCIGGVIEE
jgi:hypothetical protein